MVSVNLPNQFPRPPDRLMHNEALPGNPYGAGYYLLDRPRLLQPTDAFGIAWVAAAVPTGIGQRVAAVTTYEDPIAQILVVKKDFAGVTFNGQVVDVLQDQDRVIFDDWINVQRVGVWVYTACALNLYWLVVF